jgi:hypothetical protein
MEFSPLPGFFRASPSAPGKLHRSGLAGAGPSMRAAHYYPQLGPSSVAGLICPLLTSAARSVTLQMIWRKPLHAVGRSRAPVNARPLQGEVLTTLGWEAEDESQRQILREIAQLESDERIASERRSHYSSSRSDSDYRPSPGVPSARNSGQVGPVFGKSYHDCPDYDPQDPNGPWL